MPSLNYNVLCDCHVVVHAYPVITYFSYHRVWEGQRQHQVGFSRSAAAVLAARGAQQLESGEYQLTRDLRLRQVHVYI